MNMKKLFILIQLFICSNAFASETELAGEQSIFNGTFADALWTVLAFGGLFILLAKFAWKPLLANLMERQEHITHQIQAAQETRQQAEKILEEHKQKGIQIVSDSTDQAMLRSQQLMEKAKEEAMELKRKSDEEIKHARRAFSEHLWQQSADVILSVGTKVLGRTISKEDNQRLIDEAVAKLKQENSQ
jgi:F-type H+-transporting ATPase subunit b